MSKKFHYANKKTGCVHEFKLTGQNIYTREDGQEFNVAKLNRFYEYIRTLNFNGSVKRKYKTVININGFSNRVKNEL